MKAVLAVRLKIRVCSKTAFYSKLYCSVVWLTEELLFTILCNLKNNSCFSVYYMSKENSLIIVHAG